MVVETGLQYVEQFGTAAGVAAFIKAAGKSCSSRTVENWAAKGQVEHGRQGCGLIGTLKEAIAQLVTTHEGQKSPSAPKRVINRAPFNTRTSMRQQINCVDSGSY
ncbi:hypothetical protein KR51_00029610 [Rubidibacter lacunae KORDI 51-2]|uniref:Uncharacterized protein n=1 Tax=Rubidibacter lacunae KORDI 51-2 TaxID=582515 RepID=U5DFP7_9CHRO|nr:hypothetical protein KR51_00029610 [Rubidibacter lacunae KORDI 51-2]